VHQAPLRLRHAVALPIAWLLACTGTSIDGSSIEAAKTSIERIELELDAEDRLRFQAAVRLIVADALGESLIGGFGRDTAGSPVDSRVIEALEGRTASELIAQADAIREARATRDRSLERKRAAQESARAHAEIAKLRAQHARARHSRERLTHFRVTRARFTHQPTRFGGEPVLEVKVHNGTGRRVSTVHFEAALDGGTLPAHRVRDRLAHAVPGGLGPGETAVWKLLPRRSGRWRQVPAQPGMVLRMRATRLDGPDGEPLFSADWDERDDARLATLVSLYGD
jgi:hypothetical protein